VTDDFLSTLLMTLQAGAARFYCGACRVAPGPG